MIFCFIQSSCSSLIFDIGIVDPKGEMPVIHEPLIQTEFSFSAGLKHSERKMHAYNISWVTFQPNIVVDATVGILASVSFHPMQAEQCVNDKVRSGNFFEVQEKIIDFSVSLKA